jgi:hypothetical protein
VHLNNEGRITMSKVNSVRDINSVTIELGGKTRRLCFDLNAYAELETRFGSIEKAMQEMQSGGIKAIRTVLWTGLIHEEVVLDPITGEPASYKITPYEVGSWISPSRLGDVSKALMDAIQESYPDAENLPDEVKKQLVLSGVNTDEIAKIVPTEEEKVANAEKNA